MSGYFQEHVGDILQKLRIGPWYCLHCHRKRMILPAIREDAVDYQSQRSKSSRPVDSKKSATWSRSSSAEAEAEQSESCEEAVGGDFDGGHEHFKSLDHSLVDGDSGHQQSHESQVQVDTETKIEIRPEVILMVEEPSVDYVDVSSLPPSITLKESVGGNSTKSEPIGRSELDAIPEAEPVGNFIKDQSLVLKTTRINRFTEKFRDSVVERILTGKVSISALTENGQYCESELVSWIADKAKRQEEKIEILESDTSWNERRRKDGSGPFYPR